MKRIVLLFLLFLFLSYIVFPQDIFLCIEDQIIIRSEVNEISQQVGVLKLYDKAIIIEKNEDMIIINDKEDFWYKINFNNINGYVFGGYGVIIKEKYNFKTIDDFINNLPCQFEIKKTYRRLYTYQYNKDLMVRLSYNITFMEHPFILYLYYRPIPEINSIDLSLKYNLDIINANNGFGTGSSYDELKNANRSLEIITNHGNRGRYFIGNWGSDYTYDIAAFLFETKFDNNFNGIIINALNLWLTNNRGTNPNANNNLIKNTKNKRVKEAILFQIIYEIILRLNIE